MQNKLLFGMLLAASLGTVLPRPSQANPAPCHQDGISNVDSSGNVMRMLSGQVFRVFLGQNTTSVFWAPLDKLTVCPLGGSGYQITNLSKKSTTVKALRLYNY